ncbi:MAG: glycoside hydrolase family 16 protein [Bacteroidia bacterium]|nr:glycoside hydrolase family 16 protein [Bacteroidia bacterium]
MKRKTLIFFLQVLPVLLLRAQTPAVDPHWQLVWEDNFNTLNTSIWLVQNHFDHYGGEPQVYTSRPDNVFVSGGNLVLRARRETYSCPPGSVNEWGCARQYNTGQPYSFTSGYVETKQAYNTQYGYMEAHIQMPHAVGYWPAFWTFVGPGLPSNVNAAEIDIFEMLGHLPASVSTTNIHRGYGPGEPDYYQELVPTGFNYTSWHTYSVEWSPSKIIWYIDGVPSRLLPDHGIVDPVRLILNFALEPWTPPTASTPFPADMLIDYVRVYKLRNDCNTSIINACGYNFATHDNRVKKEIILGNGSCVNSLNATDKVHMRATDGILINGDFTVPVGAELYLDVNPCN